MNETSYVRHWKVRNHSLYSWCVACSELATNSTKPPSTSGALGISRPKMTNILSGRSWWLKTTTNDLSQSWQEDIYSAPHGPWKLIWCISAVVLQVYPNWRLISYARQHFVSWRKALVWTDCIKEKMRLRVCIAVLYSVHGAIFVINTVKCENSEQKYYHTEFSPTTTEHNNL